MRVRCRVPCVSGVGCLVWPHAGPLSCLVVGPAGSRVEGSGAGGVTPPTRRTSALSSKVNLIHTINFGALRGARSALSSKVNMLQALCGAHLVTRWSRCPQNRGERISPSPPSAHEQVSSPWTDNRARVSMRFVFRLWATRSVFRL